MKLGIPAGQRIRKSETYSKIIREGKLVQSQYLNVWVAFAVQGEELKAKPRLGIIVSRKTHSRATKRNYWKRRIREAFRRNQPKVKPESWIVVQSRRPKKIPQFETIETELLNLLSKAKALRE